MPPGQARVGALSSFMQRRWRQFQNVPDGQRQSFGGVPIMPPGHDERPRSGHVLVSGTREPSAQVCMQTPSEGAG
jgi:hypothetical protein